MSKSPFSRAELLPQEERLWVNHSYERLIVSFAKASTLQERRVAITPEGVKQLCQLGHEIIIEKDLGLHAGYDNRSYSEAVLKLQLTREEYLVHHLLSKSIHLP